MTSVAVLVATCARPELLEHRSLQSILAQTYRPDVVVVVDDSPDQEDRDRNLSIVHAAEQRSNWIIHYVVSARHGASAAWNLGIAEIVRIVTETGANPFAVQLATLYVAVLDDDDEWTTDHLERCARGALLHTIGNASANGGRLQPYPDLVIGRIDRRSSNSSTCHVDGTNRRTPATSLPFTPQQFLRGNPGVQGSNLFIRLDTLLRAGCFDDALRSCTDRDLMYRVLSLPNLVHVAACSDAEGINSATVIHFADAGRPRLSDPGSAAKMKGLDAFWSKYCDLMSGDDRSFHCKRAKEYFGWVPPDGGIASGGCGSGSDGGGGVECVSGGGYSLKSRVTPLAGGFGGSSDEIQVEDDDDSGGYGVFDVD
eukprot:TRINITY_DN12849_c0_g1_i1.p1 TRINITY_DN12849_c0_g1~~TRINITY_DN12849_c0_g1_i1.p1  ORF type:complete len:369 (-),score=72.67 TRINITY_DN12849_c0_g1_i1:48-1154(-)